MQMIFGKIGLLQLLAATAYIIVVQNLSVYRTTMERGRHSWLYT